MTRKLLTTVAAGALFATAFAPVAFSQSATQPATPGAPSMSSPADPAAQPKTPDAMKPAGDAAQAPAPAATTETADAAAGGSYLTEQAPDQVSANTYIGQSVYNGQNESIGSVSDLIMKKDGGIVAAVIGVGGFLGIGAKNVAVPMDKVAVAQNTEDGSVKLTTTETAETLKAAPEFKTLQMQSAEKAPAPGATDTTATGSTTNN